MEGLTSFLQVGGFVIAMLTIYRALSEYSKNNLFQRARILEELIDKFKKKELYVAKRILDDYIAHFHETIDPGKIGTYSNTRGLTEDLTIVHSALKTASWKITVSGDYVEYVINDVKADKPPKEDQWILDIVRTGAPMVKNFTFISLERLLRNHKGSYIGDNEVYFRDSFDQLLDFYSLLIYYLRNEIITIREVHAHFLFHLLSVKDCAPLINYIRIYYEEDDFDWLFRQLPERVTEKAIPKKRISAPETSISKKIQQIQAIIENKDEESEPN